MEQRQWRSSVGCLTSSAGPASCRQLITTAPCAASLMALPICCSLEVLRNASNCFRLQTCMPQNELTGLPCPLGLIYCTYFSSNTLCRLHAALLRAVGKDKERIRPCARVEEARMGAGQDRGPTPLATLLVVCVVVGRGGWSYQPRPTAQLPHSRRRRANAILCAAFSAWVLSLFGSLLACVFVNTQLSAPLKKTVSHAPSANV